MSLSREVTEITGLSGLVASGQLNDSFGAQLFYKMPVNGLHPGQVFGHDLGSNWPFEY